MGEGTMTEIVVVMGARRWVVMLALVVMRATADSSTGDVESRGGNDGAEGLVAMTGVKDSTGTMLAMAMAAVMVEEEMQMVMVEEEMQMVIVVEVMGEATLVEVTVAAKGCGGGGGDGE